MYEVTIRRHFDAAHFLRQYGGRCENLHGHRYEVEVSLEAEQLNSTGLVFDFTELKARLDELLAGYDHHCLNDIPPFDNANPSAENLARRFFLDLKEHFRIKAVTVWESEDASATYVEDL